MFIKCIIISLTVSSIKGSSIGKQIMKFFDSSGSSEITSLSSSEENFFKPPKFLERLPALLKGHKEFNVTLRLITSSGIHDDLIHLPLQNLPLQPLEEVNLIKETVFIIHGFMSHGRVQWMADLANAYIERKDVNIFLVDWGQGAFVMNYAIAAKNTRRTAKLVTDFINHLIHTKDFSTSGIHIIGHSLGAHISGFIGKEIPGIHRITGLDPAQPLFTNSKTARETRLHKDDAMFVDVIHTNAFIFGCGLSESIGHVDFYINGGKIQPGCPLHMMNSTYFMDPTSIANIRIDNFLTKMSCSHLRAIEYFVEAVRRTDCIFTGYKKTKSNEDFCTYSVNDTAILGLSTFEYSARGDYYIKTYSKPPYCATQLNE